MNCQTFSDLVSDIARDQMMDVATRTHALTHASECLSCAAHLEAQQRLTLDLGDLVVAMNDRTASTVVWENLSERFDARTLTRLMPNRRRRIYSAGAIAAMLLLAFAIGSIARRYRPSSKALVSSPVGSSSLQPVDKTNEPKDAPKGDVVVSVKQKPQSPPRHFAVHQASTPQVTQTKEIATDFIPLTYSDTGIGSDAQMVRVELPRSSMASFGLPVNMDRADQRVKADVLLGSDGLARAIRFVQ